MSAEALPDTLMASQLESNSLLGAPALGWHAQVLLYGVFAATHCNYVTSSMYKRIAWQVKATLGCVFIWCTIYTGLIIAENWMWTTTVNRSLEHILSGESWESVPPMVAQFVASPVQVLLVIRTFTFIRRPILRYTFGIALAVLILFGFTMGVLICAANMLYFYGNIDDIYPLDFNNCLAITLWTNAVIDLAISISLALTLKQRVAGFNERTDGLLKRLIRNALQTASYTTVLCIAGAATASAFSDQNPRFTFLSYAFFCPLPACYGLSLFTTLSTRKTIDDYIGNNSQLLIPGSAQHGVSAASPVRSGRRASQAAVAVDPMRRTRESSVEEEKGGWGKRPMGDAV
ncbi:hypothetical protein JCM8547_003013 [Rhodosporidiobolus lusitaniae]